MERTKAIKSQSWKRIVGICSKSEHLCLRERFEDYSYLLYFK